MSVVDNLCAVLTQAKDIVKSQLKAAIKEAETVKELAKLADLAYDLDQHHRLGVVIALKAQELSEKLETPLAQEYFYVGEYDRDGQYLKWKEVEDEDRDYYGFADAEIGEWVSSSY